MQEYYTVTDITYEDIHVGVAGVLTHGFFNDTAESMKDFALISGRLYNR